MSYEHHIAVLPLAGDLNVRTAPSLRRALDALVRDGCRRIVLNMADVAYVDSTAMGVMFSTLRRMREQGGLLSLINVSTDVLRSLRRARLVDLVPVSVAGARRDVPGLDPSALPLWRTTIPVEATDLRAARVRIEELAERLPFSHDEVFDLTLAAGEAMGNAVDHTCGCGVLATVSAYDDRMVVEVTDCGEGFDVDCVGTCAQADEERGRGIRLMRLLVDAVSIVPRTGATGMVVRLEKLVR